MVLPTVVSEGFPYKDIKEYLTEYGKGACNIILRDIEGRLSDVLTDPLRQQCEASRDQVVNDHNDEVLIFRWHIVITSGDFDVQSGSVNMDWSAQSGELKHWTWHLPL